MQCSVSYGSVIVCMSWVCTQQQQESWERTSGNLRFSRDDQRVKHLFIELSRLIYFQHHRWILFDFKVTLLSECMFLVFLSLSIKSSAVKQSVSKISFCSHCMCVYCVYLLCVYVNAHPCMCIYLRKNFTIIY